MRGLWGYMGFRVEGSWDFVARYNCACTPYDWGNLAKSSSGLSKEDYNKPMSSTKSHEPSSSVYTLQSQHGNADSLFLKGLSSLWDFLVGFYVSFRVGRL